MNWFLILIILIAVLVILTAKLKLRGQNGQLFPYTKNPSLFSPAERSYLGVLDNAVGSDYRVFGKVRVADVISVKSISDRRAWGRAFGRISAKHFDFVMCNKDDLSVVAVIELNDKSHQKRRRQERDKLLAGICAEVKLPFIQITAQPAYSVSDTRAQILAALETREETIVLPPNIDVITEAPEAFIPTPAPVTPPLTRSSGKSTSPSCPKCAGPMILRTAKSGANVGQKFWGCRAYPRCRTIIKASL